VLWSTKRHDPLHIVPLVSPAKRMLMRVQTGPLCGKVPPKRCFVSALPKAALDAWPVERLDLAKAHNRSWAPLRHVAVPAASLASCGGMYFRQAARFGRARDVQRSGRHRGKNVECERRGVFVKGGAEIVFPTV